MTTYKHVLARYLCDIGQLEAHQLGAINEFTPAQKASLANELRYQYERNQRLIWIVILLWFILYGIGLYFAITYHNSVANISIALIGSLMTLPLAIFALRRLWLDSSVLGALLAILPGLTPSEAAKVITTFYFNISDRKTRH